MPGVSQPLFQEIPIQNDATCGRLFKKTFAATFLSVEKIIFECMYDRKICD